MIRMTFPLQEKIRCLIFALDACLALGSVDVLRLAQGNVV